ncbi:MAG: hypothetical protein H7144_15280 [Burkholderiales bacterium]|nr:hypothetical protein [Phycisphaerae bacterium]
MMNLLLQTFMSEKGMPYLILCAGGILVLYVVARPFMKKKKDPMDKPGFMRSLSQQRSVERQMENLLVELSEMSRQMTAQLDTRAARLEILIKDADQKIGRLQQLAREEREERAIPLPNFAASDFPVTGQNLASPSDEDMRHREVYALADDGKSIPEISSALARPSGEIELILALRRT